MCPAAVPEQQPNDPAEPRLSASIEHWKRRLLDLTKRNRALNFRVTKVSTVAIVDEQPAEVFRQLYLEERTMKFKSAPEPESNGSGAGAAASSAAPEPDAAASFDAGLDVALEEAHVGPGDDFVPYDPSGLDERHRDEWLQTSAPPEALDRSLRRLDDGARASVEEQGVNTLFLALGMLHYVEADDAGQTFRAPIVLLPVELARKSARSGYTIRAGDDEPIVNPALAEHLRQSYGIALPALPDSATVPDDYDLQTLLGATGELVAGKPGWSVKTEVYLGLFSFQKLVMYKDLEAN